MEISLVSAGVNPQRLADGTALVDRVVKEATPYILWAYPMLRKMSVSYSRVMSNLKRAGGKIVVDSGGFELAEGTASGIDPVDVISVQNSLADFGFILDFPPDHLSFKECLKLTRDHVKAAASLEKRFDYYLVVHGRDISQMKEWYGELAPLDEYQGISVSGIEFSELLRGFVFCAEMGDWARWHFLGTSSIVQMSLIHYLGRKLEEAGRSSVERLTFDSTTPTKFGRVCKTYHPLIPLEVILPRKFSWETLRAFGSDFDGSPASAILTNVKAAARYSRELGKIRQSEGVAEFTEAIFRNKQLWKWRLGRQVIDVAFEGQFARALSLIPPELDRVAGLRKKQSVLQL